jgi:hypothetical protein
MEAKTRQDEWIRSRSPRPGPAASHKTYFSWNYTSTHCGVKLLPISQSYQFPSICQPKTETRVRLTPLSAVSHTPHPPPCSHPVRRVLQDAGIPGLASARNDAGIRYRIETHVVTSAARITSRLDAAWLLISLSKDTKCKGDYMEVSSSARIK